LKHPAHATASVIRRPFGIHGHPAQ
jgi:hypothetical protein